MDNVVLSLKNVCKSFGPIEILKDVNLDLCMGEAISIVGPSGTGKSTLLHIAGLMERPSSGSILIEGQRTEIMPEWARGKQRLNKIGFLFQFHYLLPDLDVFENVLMPCRLAKDDLRKAQTEAKELLTHLGLESRLRHRPSELSGGEQQRAALARALIRNPSVLLCDEPTGNLDQKTGEAVMSLIFSKIKERGVASLIVTHNEKIAEKGDRTYHLTNGQFLEKQESAVS